MCTTSVSIYVIYEQVPCPSFRLDAFNLHYDTKIAVNISGRNGINLDSIKIDPLNFDYPKQ